MWKRGVVMATSKCVRFKPVDFSLSGLMSFPMGDDKYWERHGDASKFSQTTLQPLS